MNKIEEFLQIHNIYSEDSYEIDELVDQYEHSNQSKRVKMCAVCNKKFVDTSKKNSCKYCKRIHYNICPICNNKFVYKSFNSAETPKLTCSSACGLKYGMQSKYGVINPSQLQEVQDKKKDNFREKHGVDHWSQTKEFQDKKNSTMLERYGATSAMGSYVLRTKIECTNLERYGTTNPAKNPGIKNVISSKVSEVRREQGHDWYKNVTTEEMVEKVQSTNLEKYGVLYAIQLPEVKAKMVESMRQTVQERYGVDYYSQTRQHHIKCAETRANQVSSDGFCFDSSYELKVYEYCKSIGCDIDRQVRIEFEYEGETHATLIDFRIDGDLYEVKGSHLLEGCFDYAMVVPIEKKLEIYREYGVTVITDSKAKNLFDPPKDRTPGDHPLVGIDIALFDDAPSFPYRSDRPTCFYDVQVNGQTSCHDAFYDKKFRWSLIKNRMKYVGGFIDNFAILRAMNVTKRCKQPSWFSESYATKLIDKYCTSCTIVDPFAGWGTRHDAAVKLNKKYIGIDLNPELVKWHLSKGRSISLGDAQTFEFNGDCSVFTCPPYMDTEIYFEGQNTCISECEFLRIMMKNIPNASEYVMVCKNVDSEFEPFIVETKTNKSHYGTNSEKVIVVPGDYLRMMA